MADTTGNQTRTPDEIRADIDQTREELADTVEQLGAKTDVKAQAKAKVEEVKSNVREGVSEKVSDIGDKARSATPGSAQQGGQAAAEKVKQNPLPFAIGAALILGYLIGRRAGGS